MQSGPAIVEGWADAGDGRGVVYKLLMVFRPPCHFGQVLRGTDASPVCVAACYSNRLQFIPLQFVRQVSLWQHNPELIRHVQFFLLALMRSAQPNPVTCQSGRAWGAQTSCQPLSSGSCGEGGWGLGAREGGWEAGREAWCLGRLNPCILPYNPL